MKFSIKIATATMLAALGIIPASAQSQSGPLKCSYQPQQQAISCDIVSDVADVTEIKLNRGRCLMFPALDQATRDRLLELAKSATSQNPEQKFYAQLQAMQVIAQMRITNADAADMSAKMISKISTPDDAAAYFFLNPVQKYAFGDKLLIWATNCDLLEWTIAVNGQNWTWSMN